MFIHTAGRAASCTPGKKKPQSGVCGYLMHDGHLSFEGIYFLIRLMNSSNVIYPLFRKSSMVPSYLSGSGCSTFSFVAETLCELSLIGFSSIILLIILCAFAQGPVGAAVDILELVRKVPAGFESCAVGECTGSECAFPIVLCYPLLEDAAHLLAGGVVVDMDVAEAAAVLEVHALGGI